MEITDPSDVKPGQWYARCCELDLAAIEIQQEAEDVAEDMAGEIPPRVWESRDEAIAALGTECRHPERHRLFQSGKLSQTYLKDESTYGSQPKPSKAWTLSREHQVYHVAPSRPLASRPFPPRPAVISTFTRRGNMIAEFQFDGPLGVDVGRLPADAVAIIRRTTVGDHSMLTIEFIHEMKP